MSINWNIYNKRLNANGSTERERQIERLKTNVVKYIGHNPSCKDILLNGEPTQLIINTGTQPYYKEFETLPDNQINIGDYVEWAHSHWLVMVCDSDDEIYQDGKLNQCNWLLKWQNEKGEIIERWAVIVSASKYNDGTSGNEIIELGSDQLAIRIPVDEESLKLKKNMSKKFFIDCYTSDSTVYELTGTGNVTDTYDGHGVTSWIVKECAYSPTPDDLKYGVCDYITPTTPSTPDDSDEKDDKYTNLCCSLKYSGNAELKVGGNYKTITGVITDENRNTTDEVGSFEVITIDELQSYITTNISDNVLKIKISDDESAIGGTVRIKFSTTDGKYSTYTDFNLISNY